MISEKVREKVLKLLLKIPKGKVTTYGIVGGKLGLNPRIIAAVLRGNKDYSFPCYKVVKSDGSLGGYNRGIEKKKELLKKERIKIKGNKIVDFSSLMFSYD